MEKFKQIIEAAWENRALLQETETFEAIQQVIAWLDKGELRIAQPNGADWTVLEWVKKAVILYFPDSKDGND
jgi:2,3,4,5-tetrahydropyridine-2-carboxylate N-succinyltransferase